MALGSLQLYIVRFLHQTTTILAHGPLSTSCISSVSYIKPQLTLPLLIKFRGCISSVSYIKPQLHAGTDGVLRVVYRPFPTSNHNRLLRSARDSSVVYRPFPTSNHNRSQSIKYFVLLYIVRFLHQTTTRCSSVALGQGCISSVSYINPQLQNNVMVFGLGCISSVSYIKPQL